MNHESKYSVGPYSAHDASIWDDFVDRSRNATFLLRRAYMDYHSDRFSDCSLLVYRIDGDRRTLVALFAACIGDDGQVSAHAGLTYGGLVLPVSGLDGGDVVNIMDAVVARYRSDGYRLLRYKAIPHIYHRNPSEEDIYALFRHGARLAECNLSSCIDFGDIIKFNENSRRNMRCASAAGVTVTVTDDFDSFWAILETLLDLRYDTRPVHTLAEIKRLHLLFPDNIRLVAAYDASGRMIAGTVLYLTPVCVHAQYIASSDEGKRFGALSLVFDRVIADYAAKVRYFDFGTSNEDHGRFLNRGLLRQKNGMGGRGVTYNIYEIDL